METDPVCGVRLTRSLAIAERRYCGLRHLFCSPACLEAFEHSPERYVPARGTGIVAKPPVRTGTWANDR
jgi:YHS domain-containing protein